MSGTEITVSVCITAYNHERFIAQALDSVLMQQAGFPFEILVGEDQSSDGTREIVRDYARRNPELIRSFLHDHPPGYYRVNGRMNVVNNFRNARGRYIALLDGDDYWTDPSKLRKQVDFLETNPDCSGCFHNVLVLRDDSTTQPHQFHDPSFAKRRFSLSDLLVSNFVPTCSVMFRTPLVKNLPDWYMNASVGDWPLHVINAGQGPYGYLDEVMGVYRVHTSGFWSGYDVKKVMQTTISLMETFHRHVPPRVTAASKRKMAMLKYELSQHLLDAGCRQEAIASALSALSSSPVYPKVWLRVIGRMLPRLLTSSGGQRCR